MYGQRRLRTSAFLAPIRGRDAAFDLVVFADLGAGFAFAFAFAFVFDADFDFGAGLTRDLDEAALRAAGGFRFGAAAFFPPPRPTAFFACRTVAVT